MPVIRQKRSGNITKSGAITVLPKNQLKSLDNLQGTIPLDLSINGHELINTDLKFDDSSKNYVFGQNYAFGNISEGIPTEDDYYGNIISLPNTVGTSFSKNGTLSKEFLKDPRQRSNLSVSFRPYKEENQIEVDSASEFYVSGTSPLVSANFQQSLLSREKIEIGFRGLGANNTPNEAISLLYSNDDGNTIAINNFSYFNFKEKNWTKYKGYITNTNERTGSSVSDYEELSSNIRNNPENLAIPFAPSAWSTFDAVSSNYQYVSGSVAEPISNFGFPFSKKYEPYEDNMINMSSYIDKPFLLEKVIIKCKLNNYASLSRDISAGQVMPYPMSIFTNIFLINNKPVLSKRKINNSINDTVLTLSGSEEEYNFCGEKDSNNSRELITYAKIITASTGSMSLPDAFSTKETYSIEKLEDQADLYQYAGNNPGSSFLLNSLEGEIILNTPSLEVQIEVPVRQSIKNKYISYLHMGDPKHHLFVGNPYGTRTLLGNDLNRSLVNNSENYSSILTQYNSDIDGNVIFNVLDNDNRQVPYILYPEDKLTIGATTFSNLWIDNNIKLFTFIDGDAKIILVGTPINDDRPKFEFDKRFLTSKNLRAGIVGDKFNTDRFDTLPLQFYASSSIDKIIESTGNRIIDRAVSGYYSNGNRGTHLKAVELQNSDISLTGSLLSEKAHFNYNSFGNFSDLYSQRKNTSYFKTGDNVVIYPVEKKFYDTDGNKLHQTGTLSFNSDFNAKISTWFEES